jgi:hypothetical protein
LGKNTVSLPVIPDLFPGQARETIAKLARQLNKLFLCDCSQNGRVGGISLPSGFISKRHPVGSAVQAVTKLAGLLAEMHKLSRERINRKVYVVPPLLKISLVCPEPAVL